MWKKSLDTTTNMEIIRLITTSLQTNTYVLYNEDKAILIDPGDNAEFIERELKERNLKCECVLLTHAHFDHCNAVAYFAKHGAKVYMYNGEEKMLINGRNLKQFCENGFNDFIPNFLLTDEEELALCGIKIKVLHTPGHTLGSCCYIAGKNIFSGDTLFKLGMGRTDLPTGDYSQLIKSLNRLYALEGDYEVFPGHGEKTTLSYERRYNRV